VLPPCVFVTAATVACHDPAAVCAYPDGIDFSFGRKPSVPSTMKTRALLLRPFATETGVSFFRAG